jgi:hypothetical protein
MSDNSENCCKSFVSINARWISEYLSDYQLLRKDTLVELNHLIVKNTVIWIVLLSSEWRNLKVRKSECVCSVKSFINAWVWSGPDVISLNYGNNAINGFLSLRHGASSGCGWTNGLQMWSVAANILNKQTRTADKVWSFSLGVGGWKRY